MNVISQILSDPKAAGSATGAVAVAATTTSSLDLGAVSEVVSIVVAVITGLCSLGLFLLHYKKHKADERRKAEKHRLEIEKLKNDKSS